MGRKGRHRPRSNKAIARDRFPLGTLSQRRKLLQEEYLERSNVLKQKNRQLKKLKEKVSRYMSAIFCYNAYNIVIFFELSL